MMCMVYQLCFPKMISLLQSDKKLKKKIIKCSDCHFILSSYAIATFIIPEK